MALILQFTGMSGAGKTSIANAFSAVYPDKKIKIIDGDFYRKTLCADLGFSRADRIENVRRLGQLAAQISQDYHIIIIAAINPYEEGRALLRETCGAKLVFVHCGMDVLLLRDTKGLYRRALLADGDPEKLQNLTGINDVFEIPKDAALTIDTSSIRLADCVTKLCNFVAQSLNEKSF